MPNWNQLLVEVEQAGDRAKEVLDRRLGEAFDTVSARRDGRNVVLYASCFLQKPHVPPLLQTLSKEDVNGFMAAVYGMDCSKGLTLILHTPGGDLNAVETVVEYLVSKFDYIEVVVPTYAMSAGTMLALASQKVVMGRQSHLGPTDPQLAGRFSAGAIVSQFEEAREEILANPAAAHAWAPVLQGLGPSLYHEAKNAVRYSTRMVQRWLQRGMFRDREDPAGDAQRTASHFGDTAEHLSHGRRIDRDEARRHHVNVEDLEDDQEFQDAVLTIYHLATILFEKSPATKLIHSGRDGNSWVKNHFTRVG